MFLLAANLSSLEQVGVFLVGIALGAVANWAIYGLAWNPREISPWGPPAGWGSAQEMVRSFAGAWLGGPASGGRNSRDGILVEAPRD